MKKPKKPFFIAVALIVACALVVVGCAQNAPQQQTEEVQPQQQEDNTQQEQPETVVEDAAEEDVEEGSAATEAPSLENATSISLEDTGAVVEGTGAEAQGNSVTISQGGTYLLTGNTTDGNVVVNTPDEDVVLVLGGVSIESKDGPAILIQDAANATVYLQENTQNTLQDSGESDYDGVLYGVVSYTIAGDGALRVNGTVEEGIASEMHLVIESGEIDITAPDDGINANNDGISEITISGGSITINAGGDGIDSNGSIAITGGEVYSYGAVDDMNSGLDADGDITITGGTVVATGANSPPPAEGAQNYIVYNFDAVQAESTTVSIQQDGQELFSADMKNTYQSIFYSSPDVAEGVEYEVLVNGTAVGTVNVEQSTQAQQGGGPGGGPGGQGQPPQGDPPEGIGEPPQGDPPEGMGEPPQGTPPGEPPEGMGEQPQGDPPGEAQA